MLTNYVNYYIIPSIPKMIYFERVLGGRILKKILVLLLMILIVILGIRALGYFGEVEKNKNEKISEEERQLKIEVIEDTSVKMAEELVRRNTMYTRYEKALTSQVELVLLTESGKVDITHDKTPENKWWLDWLIDSYVKLSSEYKLIVTIPIDAIYTSIDENGFVLVKYDESKIYIKSVELLNTVTDSWTAAYGQKYTPKEMVALMNISKQNVYDSANADIDLHYTARQNLETELLRIAHEIGFTSEEIEVCEIKEQAF